MSEIIASMAHRSDPWTAAGAARPANPSKAETVSQGNKEYEPLKLIRTTEDKPRSIDDINADHRAIEALAMGHAIRALEQVQNSTSADKSALLALQVAALERSAEIVRARAQKIHPQTTKE